MIDKNDYSVDWTKWVLTQLAGAKVDAFVLICKFFLRRIINNYQSVRFAQSLGERYGLL